jgi:hypothetical protein
MKISHCLIFLFQDRRIDEGSCSIAAPTYPQRWGVRGALAPRREIAVKILQLGAAHLIIMPSCTLVPGVASVSELEKIFIFEVRVKGA